MPEKKGASRRHLRLAWVFLLFLMAACEGTPSPATPTAGPTSTPVPPAASPIAQGWIFTLPALKQENNFELDLEVIAQGGAPIGALSIGSGQSYAKQGKPYLISTIQISTNGKPFIELSAASSPATQGNLIQPAKQDQTYEKTTPEGWQVRATIKALAVTDHPDLGDGTEGVNPVFTALDMDVEISGSGDSAYLGLTADDVSANRAGVENLRGPDLQLLDHGVVVRQVTPDGPASKAGLQQGDVILSINDQKIDRYTPLNVLLSRLHPGDKVNLDVVRDTRPLKVEVTLGKR